MKTIREHLLNITLVLGIISPVAATMMYLEYQQIQLESNPEVYGIEIAELPKARRIAPLLPDQRQAIALNAYEEARGEGKNGMIAVTNTVHHRIKDPEFPKTYHEVIYQPKQFSWTNSKVAPEINEEGMWETALYIADLELKGKLPDLVHGARFYANVTKVDIKRHKWVKEYTPLAQVGNHTYMDKPEYVKRNNLKPNKQSKTQPKPTKIASL